MNETDLMHSVMLKATLMGNTIFRSNVGKVKTADGRWFDTGLPKGHSDLYGFRPDGRVFYIETKMHPRKPTKEQLMFLKTVINKGAIGGVAYTLEEAISIMEWKPEFAAKMQHAIQGALLKYGI